MINTFQGKGIHSSSTRQHKEKQTYKQKSAKQRNHIDDATIKTKIIVQEEHSNQAQSDFFYVCTLILGHNQAMALASSLNFSLHKSLAEAPHIITGKFLCQKSSTILLTRLGHIKATLEISPLTVPIPQFRKSQNLIRVYFSRSSTNLQLKTH